MTIAAAPWLLGIFIFLIPFSLDTSIKELCFYTTAACCAIAMASGRLHLDVHTPVTRPYLAFLLWVVISIPFTMNTPNTVNDIYAHLIKYLVLTVMVAHFFSNRTRFTMLTWLIVASGTVYTIWYLIYYYGYLGRPWGPRFILFPYRDFIYVFSFLVAAGHLFYTRRMATRIIAGVAMTVLLTATVISLTRNAMLAIIVGTLVLSPKKKQFVAVLIVTFALLLAVYPDLRVRLTSSDMIKNERLSINWVTMGIIRDYPVFGIGFGMQTYENPAFIDLKKRHEMVPEQIRSVNIFGSPHNTLLDVWVRTGTIGLCLFLWILIAFARMLIPLARRSPDPFIRHWALCSCACGAGFLVQALFNDATFDLQALVFYTNLAMAIILWRMPPRTNAPSAH